MKSEEQIKERLEELKANLNKIRAEFREDDLNGTLSSFEEKPYFLAIEDLRSRISELKSILKG